MPDKNELIRNMLEELKTPSKKLTDWENAFFESISDQFDRKGTLSDKQVEILERLYTEKTD